MTDTFLDVLKANSEDAMLTGSRAVPGAAHAGSDWDYLVLNPDWKWLEASGFRLREIQYDPETTFLHGLWEDPDGHIDLIVFEEPIGYGLWRDATLSAVANMVLDREERIKLFRLFGASHKAPEPLDPLDDFPF